MDECHQQTQPYQGLKLYSIMERVWLFTQLCTPRIVILSRILFHQNTLPILR